METSSTISLPVLASVPYNMVSWHSPVSGCECTSLWVSGWANIVYGLLVAVLNITTAPVSAPSAPPPAAGVDFHS